MSDPLDEGLRACAEALRENRTDADALAGEARRRAAARDDLNAFVSLDTRVPARSAHASPLAGVPFAQKDNFCTAGLRTTCASRMLDGFVPPYESAVGERLQAAGAVSIGKTNLDEFAMGSSNETSHYGPVRNPWDPTRVPGGSSGGSAAAVAAGIVPFATGSDTGGSVRQPAAFCGVTGLKPTYGRVSRWGLIAYASSLDCPGVLARSAEDCACVLGAIAGHDPRDATSAARPAEDYLAALDAPLAGLRIGVARPYFGAGVEAGVGAAVQAALAEYERLGARLVEIDLPHAHLAIPAYYVIAPAEASSNLARYDGVRFGHRCAHPRSLEDLYTRSRAEGFGAEVRRRILIGTFALSAGYYDAYYLSAQKARRLIAGDFDAAFAQVDLIAGPTAPTTAFALGEKSADPLAMAAADVNTVAVNLAGLPALSIPAGLHAGLPVGLQLIAPAFAEARLLAAAHRFQQATDWHRRRPGGRP
ncbi:MAG TPA: Asp-tRNA(Asn)/Glu-tRNA(Gln) amidotransferase subunit GatA [Dokdonella sp.]|uniref:Asp-tRNA(Asn)/Glu-tRNA(Gln) amidotransferase subunit GatA n=1 Tax=Dokdonella sp. TaxID=2291710 RepID=UPI002C7203E7|nr:Asp-tRNA(Asn)/Glu-tRNA(Gln) amidotransferase subunit GatA [Dokdonella sp.]HUD40754.1 Asp-tRNA(Asn)/Glu-tRNA(Gln) amidotransferase subunit GatA [Dokdonella sp.]